jgi:hypothetical protein
MQSSLQERLTDKDVLFETALTENDQLVVALVTPLMLRAHDLRYKLIIISIFNGIEITHYSM